MTDREKLIALYNRLEDEGLVCIAGKADMADLMIANGVTVQRWIPVTERLPESHNLVVALTTGGDRIVAQRDKYGWLRYGGYECERLRPITHWMPLPDPPKEVE